METNDMIPASDFCSHHNIELSLITSFSNSGLVETVLIEEKIFVPTDQLTQLEKLIHLYEMDINVEGIETISYLMERMQELQQKLMVLNNRLSMYEN